MRVNRDIFSMRLWLGGASLAAALFAASCNKPAPPPPTPPPPPPPPPVVAIPPRPTPPDGASPNMVVPPLGPDGLRVSINRGISPVQTLWNLRSAWNVAALDCPEAQFPVQDSYRAFLTNDARLLRETQRKMDAEFRAKYGVGFMAQRDAYLTSVYNHFALPPTLPYFCAAVVAMAHDAEGVTPDRMPAFAQAEMPSVEIVFDQFYQQYEKYRADLAAWDAKYGPPAGSGGAATIPAAVDSAPNGSATAPTTAPTITPGQAPASGAQ